jgi:HEAT repeat protein
MNIPVGRRIWTIFFSLLALSPLGCDSVPTWVPFQGPRSDTIAGLETPSETIAKLKKYEEQAAKSDAETKHRIALQLAEMIRKEKDPSSRDPMSRNPLNLDPLIRVEIIRVLAEYPDPAGDAVLKNALNDPDADVRIAACDSWGKRGDAQAVPLLAPMLSGDVNKDVRLAAARALGKIKDQQSVQALGDALLDSDPAMQYRAVMSLKEVTGQNLGNNVDRWRQYVKEGHVPPAEPTSIAEKIKKVF